MSNQKTYSGENEGDAENRNLPAEMEQRGEPKGAGSKSHNLLKNTGILAIGNFSSKILVFLLVPLYTAVLTAEEYGSYDIIYSTVSLLIPIFSLNISDALLRFPMDEGADLPRIARTGLLVTLISGLPVLAIQLLPNAPWSEFVGIGWLAPLYTSTALYQTLTFLARGLERMKDIAIAGVASSIILVALNVALLVFVKMGLDGYFVANVVAMFAPAVWLAWRMRKEISVPSKGSGSGLFAQMARYSLPLASAAVGWWLIGTSDRYIVMMLCGVDANGLYSVAYRIPSILSTVSTIFIQAWQVSAIKGFDPKDSDGFLRKTFASAESAVVLLCAVLIPLSPLIACVMFSGEFYEAWVYVPLLLVYAVVNAMGGMWSPFFSASYDPAPMAWSTFLGGAVNVLSAVPLVLVFGVQGACLSSVLAGLANWGLRALLVRRHLKVSYRARRSLVLYMLLSAQALVMCASLPAQVWIPVELAFVICFVAALRRELVGLCRPLLQGLKRKGA